MANQEHSGSKLAHLKAQGSQLVFKGLGHAAHGTSHVLHKASDFLASNPEGWEMIDRHIQGKQIHPVAKQALQKGLRIAHEQIQKGNLQALLDRAETFLASKQKQREGVSADLSGFQQGQARRSTGALQGLSFQRPSQERTA
ncbi:MAG: hypothetical protein PW734_11355 [Verrucomicrobium sp.]|nr:hypothetical protein [Verrucomicrobium sp.]